MTNDICEVIVTADNPDWLVSFTRSLVEDRLCACAQHVAPIRSIYRWEGEIQDDTEARVALHTHADLVPQLIERIRRDHPYDVPCILVFPVTNANPDYADWVRAEMEP